MRAEVDSAPHPSQLGELLVGRTVPESAEGRSCFRGIGAGQACPHAAVRRIGAGLSLREWLTTCIRSLFRRGVWLAFNDAIAEFAELILIGTDGEEDCHEKENFPKDKVEFRAAIDR